MMIFFKLYKSYGNLYHQVHILYFVVIIFKKKFFWFFQLSVLMISPILTSICFALLIEAV